MFKWIKKLWNKLFHKKKKEETPKVTYDCYIQVNHQGAFDNLQEMIEKCVANGYKNILVDIHKSFLTFKENHLVFNNKDWSDVAITFKGDNTTIKSESRPVDTLNPRYGYDINIWTELVHTDRLIEVVDEEKKLCRIYNNYIQVNAEWINITQWYYSKYYKVEKIEGNWIYFIDPTLTYNKSYKCWSVNLDYGFGKCLPRFRTAYAVSDKSNLYKNTVFFEANKSKFKKISFDGINFIHNAMTQKGWENFQKGSSDPDKALFNLNSIEGQVTFNKCKFEHIMSEVINLKNTTALIYDCFFNLCWQNGINAQSCNNLIVMQNYFTDMNLGMMNRFCIRASGKNINISSNICENFGYGAIWTGYWHGVPNNPINSGVIENNHIYFTSDYLSERSEHTLMDGGAIYLATQNTDIIVCNNYIHDYAGMAYYRGIFCDDGAFNFTIKGNIVINTPNNFSIDSRRCLSIEKGKSFKVNVNNTISYNIVDGAIKFEGRDEDANCVMRENYLLECREPQLASEFFNIKEQEAIVSMPCDISGTSVRVSEEDYKKIKTLNGWIKKWINYGNC